MTRDTPEKPPFCDICPWVQLQSGTKEKGSQYILYIPRFWALFQAL